MNKKRKKRNHTRTKRSWITDVPVGVCVILIVMGLVIGNIFVFVTWHDGKLIDRGEAIAVTATFDSYVTHYSAQGSLYEIDIHFNDRKKISMDGACFNVDVERALDRLQSGDRVDLLLHPNSDYIWEMKTEEEVILSFDDAKSRIRTENIFFTVVCGTFGYFCAGLSAFSLILRWVKRRKKA